MKLKASSSDISSECSCSSISSKFYRGWCLRHGNVGLLQLLLVGKPATYLECYRNVLLISGFRRGVTALRSFRILRGVDWEFVTDVSGQRVGPIFKRTALVCLTLEGGRDKSVTKYQSTLRKTAEQRRSVPYQGTIIQGSNS